MRRHRKVKIVATLGPSSSDFATIRALFEAGADVFRLNMSHGSHEDHRARYDAIRAVEAQGASPKSFCAVNTGQALRHVPGFEGAPTGFSPLKLREWFLTLPGVTSKRHQDGDPANNHNVLLRQKNGVIAGYGPDGQLHARN